MEEITVMIGSLETGNSGITNDTRQAVTFVGEKLGEYREYGHDKNGKITDLRGTTETLYRVADGQLGPRFEWSQLVVHSNEWSRWSGEPNTETLEPVDLPDLAPGGCYAGLGAVCGFGRPLTLAEVFKPPAEDTERIELTFTLREDASDREIQQEIEGFVSGLVGLHWADENPLIGRLADALLGVVEYEDTGEEAEAIGTLRVTSSGNFLDEDAASN